MYALMRSPLRKLSLGICSDWGITPSDDYYDKQGNKIYLKWKKSALNSVMPTRADFKLLPN